MSSQPHHPHITITETLVRLYVFLAQYLDRCLDESARRTFPEEELQKHLSATRASMSEMLAVNPVVKSKVERECERVLNIGAECLRQQRAAKAPTEELQRERAVLQNKTIALSDLLAVFRAIAA